MSKTSAAAKNRYAAKTYDRITVLVKKGEREKYKQLAESKGQTLSSLINKLLQEEMQEK